VADFDGMRVTFGEARATGLRLGRNVLRVIHSYNRTRYALGEAQDYALAGALSGVLAVVHTALHGAPSNVRAMAVEDLRSLLGAVPSVVRRPHLSVVESDDAPEDTL